MIFSSILTFDQQLTQFINRLIPHNWLFNQFFSFLSIRTNSLPIWIVIIILLIFFEEKIDKKFIIYFLVSIAISLLAVFVLKDIFRRARPSTLCGTDFSFPSGHATIAFASATILAEFDKKRKWGYFLVAVLIALSRIYLQCHFLLDIAGGSVMGFMISKLLLLSMFRNFRKRPL